MFPGKISNKNIKQKYETRLYNYTTKFRDLLERRKKEKYYFSFKKEEEEFLAIQSARDFAQLIWSGLKEGNASFDLQLSFVRKVNTLKVVSNKQLVITRLFLQTISPVNSSSHSKTGGQAG